MISFLKTARTLCLSKVQGSQEKRTSRIPNTVRELRTQPTQQFAKNKGGVSGSARQQAFVARGSGESGMAALVVTVVLISLLSAIAVSFAVIMNRELQKSVNNQLGQAAYNAAASGINDSISYLRDNPNINVTQCQDLLSTGKPLSLSSDLSGNGNTKYTCVLINTIPHDIEYPGIPANKSQIVKANLSTSTSKFMFSWQATNRDYDNFPLAADAGKLFDETTWNINKYTPMLRVSLYPIPADSKDASFANANSRTYYLYPTRATGFSVNTMSYSKTAGTLQPVECGLKNNNGQFNGNGAFDCNLIIKDLPIAPAGYLYFIRLTPLYGTADVQVRANDATPASGEVSFVSTQAIIDVTAQSSTAVKRLQARVDISGLNGNSQDISASDDAFPEYALRSANTVCKLIQNPGSSDLPAYISKDMIGNCGSDLAGLAPLEPPTVSGRCEPAGDYTTAKCTGTINPNNGKITYCKLLIDGSEKYDCSSLFPPTHSTTPKDFDQNFNIGSGDHSYSLCADNPAGRSNPCATGSFNIPSPPPPPPPPQPAEPYLLTFDVANPNCAPTNNCYVFTGLNLNLCTLHTDNPPGGVQSFISAPNGGTVPIGNGPPIADAWLQCGNSILHTGQSQPPPPPDSVTVIISKPTNFWSHADYDFTFATSVPSQPNDCRDGLHNYIACFNIDAYAGADTPTGRNNIWYCDTSVSSGFGTGTQRSYNGPSQGPHWSSKGKWIEFTLGYSRSVPFTGPTSPYTNDNFNATITVTCHGYGAEVGSASQGVHWSTCADRNQYGQYYTDVNNNGCDSKKPPL